MGGYFDPENHGLVSVIDVSLRDESYTFAIAAVWFRPEDGKFYAGTDSGCSCPSPFEDFRSLGDYEGPFTRAGVMGWMRNQTADDRLRVIDAVEHIRHFEKAESRR